MSTLLAFVLASGLESAAHTQLHPRDADLFVEVLGARVVVDRLRSAPAGRFIDDPEVQKLGALLQQLGIDLGGVLRGSMPKLSAENGPPALFDAGDLGDVSISWSGLDEGGKAGAGLSERAGVVFVCDFSSAIGAARCTAAFRDARWLTDAVPATEGPESGSTRVEWSEHPLERHRLEAFGVELDAWSVHSGSRWILFAGTQTPELVSARLAAKNPALPARGELFDAEKSFTPSTGAVVARIHADLATLPLAGAVERSGVAGQLLSALIPFAGRRGFWRIELRGERFVTEAAYQPITSGGPLDQLQDLRPIAAGSARHVPKEAVGAWLLQVRPERIRPALDALLGASSREPSSDERDAKLDALFRRGLGSSASISMLPITSLPVGGSGSLVPRILVTFELADRSAFQAALAEFVERSKARNPGLVVEERPYRKVPITVFETAGSEESAPGEAGEAASVFSMLSVEGTKPCVVLLEDRVLVTLSPTHARAEIQRNEKRSKDDELHPIAMAGRFPAEVVEASSIDWSGLFGKLYDTARGFAPMLAQGGTLPFDPATLPASSAFVRFFQPSYSWTKRTERGLYTYSESSFGPETPIVVLAAVEGLSRTPGMSASALLGGGGAARSGAPGLPGPTAEGTKGVSATTSPPKDEARERTLTAMRSIKTGIAVYRSQMGKVPATLAMLLESTDAFPNGFLDPRSIPKDGWQGDLRYMPDPDAKKYKLWSCGPDGIDQQGAGDDVLAP